MKRFLMPYLHTDSYHSQIEGSAYVNLRLAYTCLGIACWPMRRNDNETWLRRLMPLFSLAVWHHTGQCEQRWVFRLRLLGKTVIGYKTKGETSPGHWRYEDRGLHIFSWRFA